MDADVGKLHTPAAASEAVDEGCRRVRERGQIAIVWSATSVDKSGQRMQSVERLILAALMGHSTGCAVFRSRLFAFIHSDELNPSHLEKLKSMNLIEAHDDEPALTKAGLDALP